MINNSRDRVYSTVNTEMLKLYWNIGKIIMEFYICFPIATTVLSQLSWSHYLELIKIKEENKRNFYLKEVISSKWSVRELQRQKNSLLYERLLLSKDKEKVLELAEKGQVIKTGKDLVKDPFVLEFLDIEKREKKMKILV